jgi:hypothetical protein
MAESICLAKQSLDSFGEEADFLEALLNHILVRKS